MLTILILMLAGAVLNVAVAWGCALLVPLGDEHGQWAVEQHPEHDRWLVLPFQRAGAVFVMSLPHTLGDLIKTERRPADLLPFWFPKHDLGSIQFADARGWPFVSLWCSYEEINSSLVMTVVGGLDPGLRRWTKGDWVFSYPRGLPLRPIWRHFPLNTLFYAAVLWLLIPGPFTLRRFLRVRRGLCPKCAYPRRESPVCSECGAELPERAVRVAG